MDAAILIHTARNRAGMTLRALAQRAQTSHATLSAYEQGHKIPRLDTFDRILGAAGFVLDAALVRRPGHQALDRGAELVDVLTLADAFPFHRHGPLEYPVFGRAGDPP
jgi:transcriptional regulator with XRE-family HTH domain